MKFKSDACVSFSWYRPRSKQTAHVRVCRSQRKKEEHTTAVSVPREPTLTFRGFRNLSTRKVASVVKNGKPWVRRTQARALAARECNNLVSLKEARKRATCHAMPPTGDREKVELSEVNRRGTKRRLTLLCGSLIRTGLRPYRPAALAYFATKVGKFIASLIWWSNSHKDNGYEGKERMCHL